MNETAQIIMDDPTTRQRDVLDAVLDLIVRGERPLSMNAVAREASCSKETLYRWFGDRDGMLTAMVQWQAAKVREVQLPAGAIDHAFLRGELKRFAADWLSLLSGSRSIALNRLAVAEAGSKTLDLGAIVLRNGPVAMARRLEPLLDAGCAAGLIAIGDRHEAFSTFFGLVVGDHQIRLLLGEALSLPPEHVEVVAARAADRFLSLYPFRAATTAPDDPTETA